MMQKVPMRTTLFLLALFAASPSFAHDFWIEPSTFRPARGENVTATLVVGQNFTGDAVPRSSQLIESFTIRDSSGERSISGFENQNPAGYLRAENVGIAIIGYRSKPSPLELPAAKFEEFLKMEGLEKISSLRAAHGESQKADRERFFRYAKSVIQAGSASATVPAKSYSQRFGYRYELIPETNPMTSSPLRLRALFEGKPLPGALVSAIFRDDPSIHTSARTDAQGRVALSLPRNGVWLVKSVQMVAAPAGTNADWESLWASLTFER